MVSDGYRAVYPPIAYCHDLVVPPGTPRSMDAAHDAHFIRLFGFVVYLMDVINSPTHSRYGIAFS